MVDVAGEDQDGGRRGTSLSAGDALDQVYHSGEGVVEGGPVVEIF